MSFPLTFYSLKQVTEPWLSQRGGKQTFSVPRRSGDLGILVVIPMLIRCPPTLTRIEHIFSGTHGIFEKLEHILGIKGISTNSSIGIT